METIDWPNVNAHKEALTDKFGPGYAAVVYSAGTLYHTMARYHPDPESLNSFAVRGRLLLQGRTEAAIAIVEADPYGIPHIPAEGLVKQHIANMSTAIDKDGAGSTRVEGAR